MVKAKGSCLCGQLRIAVDGDPLVMAHCCCVDCQKASGGGHMSIARFREQDVVITGEYATYGVIAGSGNTNYRHFCPTCGGRGFGTNSGRPGQINVSVGIFEDSSWFAPKAAIFTRDHRHWDDLDGELPQFEEYPPA